MAKPCGQQLLKCAVAAERAKKIRDDWDPDWAHRALTPRPLRSGGPVSQGGRGLPHEFWVSEQTFWLQLSISSGLSQRDMEAGSPVGAVDWISVSLLDIHP